ncbi:hypothetical protein [Kitasatospora azatica]|uniref:hypothetical protein n=1 Tax=Kitasatospora azatica TaxID=58347 RepID=UPI00068B75EC|nr:hypothetical protein [Kitasatospora azatica]
MDFFDSIPRPEEPAGPERPKPPVWMRPDDVMPVSLPLTRMLLRSPKVAVFTDGLRAYPEGFEFTVQIRWAPGVARDRRSGPFGWHGGRPDQPSGDELRFGVLFPDGSRAAADGFLGLRLREQDVRPPLIHGTSGGGGSGTWEQKFWVWGLPETGPVTLVCAWSAEGLAEHRVELDGDALRAAAAQAESLWTT